MRHQAEYRAVVVAKKHRNGCEAKDGRKMDAGGSTHGRETDGSARNG